MPSPRLEKATFFVKRALVDIVRPYRFGVSKNYKPTERPTDSHMPYVLAYSTEGMVKRYGLKFDEEGIAMTKHYIHQGEGHYYSPVKIAHFGLACLNDALSGAGNESYEAYRSHLHWLIENYADVNGEVIWRVPSTSPKYDLGFNYVSAISQGLALSLLARSEPGPTRSRAAELSDAALIPMTRPVADGGLLGESKWGPCYEEYPCIPFSHVVNGFVFCLNGLYDAYAAFRSDKAKALFDAGLETLENMTREWFIAGWARYDLRDLYTGGVPNLATRHYQYLHADQMMGLGLITREPKWFELSRKFERQALNPIGLAYAYWSKARKWL